MAKRLIFLLGGARSGKSTYAENWAQQHGTNVLFVATAQGFDDEMRERITHHRNSRPSHWHTLEAPLNVGAAIKQKLNEAAFDTVLLDCITLLTSNVLLTLSENSTEAQVNRAVLAETDAILAAYSNTDAAWLIVSNEVGMGVIPPTKLGRLYRDALGRANQRIAHAADEVLLLVAGLPWTLKR